MLKYVLLASAMTLATPVLAQDSGQAMGADQSTSHKEKKSKNGQRADDGATTMTNDSAPVDATAAPADAAPAPDASTLPSTPATPPTDPSMTPDAYL